MQTTTTTLETLQATVDYWNGLRTTLRAEALHIGSGPSHDDRMAEIARITARLAKLYASMDALEA